MNSENLIPLSSGDCWNRINAAHGTKGGVYKVISVKYGKRVPINRLLGADTAGVLYIGKADSFLKRVIDLRKALSPVHKSSAHGFGYRYKHTNSLNTAFPFENLFVELIETQDPRDLEYKWLKKYLDTFGEVPPLNAVL